jgi:hypothetical protein
VNTFGDGFGEADGWWDGGGASKLSHKAFLSIERRNIENEHIFSSMGQK